ncbi:hypothetical protein SPBR_00956 [Sporothrix brasiliensis 5110]|uniref:Uncharacterized protein n=1 Tax=Sporothrix brasiliensis 5110 TaxID=1398154 RepID=A0A0C2FGZ2_9PEZI|nr:uncharacterized protein SPBR_00956 [Sporothrix brasiliensis 5110]KIH90358.1 hypothetical protein SPBR_00956 [Sporothrix brasiliensis 5110]
MQRRRQTPQNNTAPFSSPSTSTSHSGTAGFPQQRQSQRQRQSSTGTQPPTSLMNSGIELRDRSARADRSAAHGTSSSISSRQGLYQRTSSAAAASSASNYASYQAPSLHAQPPVSDTIFIMKPLVGAIQAWSCVVISVFAILILSIMGLLFRANHHEMVGGVDDPENGPEVAATIFVAVLVYAGFLVFCGLQGLLHLRENRRGAIAL